MLVWVLAINIKTRVPVVYLAASEVIGSRSVHRKKIVPYTELKSEGGKWN